jgi:hypothetical protein
MKCSITLPLLFCAAALYAQPLTSKTIIYSQNVRDSFELYISTPQHMDSHASYDVVYYCDANLKSGKKLRELIGSPTHRAKTERTIFVGIGHIGNFHVLRRRDFIVPIIANGDTSGRSANYGQTELFYRFLTTELMPDINARYKTNTANNSIAGHSLGGLFAFYCLFKNDTVFKNYYALSPALWIEHYSIYKFNSLKTDGHFSRNLYFSTGGLELVNHIRTGTNRMNRLLTRKKYPNLQVEYQIHKGKTHNSQVEQSLEYMLRLE